MTVIRVEAEEREWLGSVGARLGILRRRRRVSAEILARRARIHRNTVDRVESGRVNCSIVLLRRIADALGADIDDLLVNAPCKVKTPGETLELPEKPCEYRN